MNHTTRKHARLSPSASHRWMSCPGSLALCEKVPKPEESEYAAIGTAAHELAELCLLNKRNASEYLGETIRISDSKSYVIDSDMAQAVQVYLDEIRNLVGDDIENLMIEKRFDLGWIYTGIFGSNDASYLCKETKRLHVWDYKNGRGVVVDAEWNSQLMIYALGALAELHKLTVEKTKQPCNVMDICEEVVLTIVQPNAFHEDGTVRYWTIKTADLLFWGLNVLKPAAIRTEKESGLLIDGDHCKFCNAIAICPQQVKSVMAAAKTEFEAPIFPAPESLSAHDIVKILKVAENVSTWVGQVKQYAQSKMEMGVPLPGFKLVRKKANRKWINEAVTLQRLESILGEEAYKKEVLSVAQAEKVLKAKKLSPEAELSGLWEKPNAGLSMVDESDARQAVEPETSFQPVNMLEWDYLN